jgi:hypothetical protein
MGILETTRSTKLAVTDFLQDQNNHLFRNIASIDSWHEGLDKNFSYLLPFSSEENCGSKGVKWGDNNAIIDDNCRRIN